MSKEEAMKDLEDVEEVEDFFEKVLNEDIEIPTDDDDEDANTSDKKVESSEGKQTEGSEETVESLKAKIAELERERKGQLNDVVKSRQERQLFKSELTQLKDAVAVLLEKRSEALEKEEEEKPVPLSDPRAKVEFGDDDKAYVDLSQVKDAITAETAHTKQELNELKAQRAEELAQQKWIKNVSSIVSEDKRFGPAYQELKQIYEDLNNKVIEFQTRTENYGDEGVLDVDTALDLLSGSPEEKEFLDKYPGVDPTRIARAFNTKVDLRSGLRHLANTLKISSKDTDSLEGKLDEKIAKAKSKPGTLARQENRSSGDTSDLIERIAEMSYADFESLSNAEAARIEQMLRNAETKGE